VPRLRGEAFAPFRNRELGGEVRANASRNVFTSLVAKEAARQQLVSLGLMLVAPFPYNLTYVHRSFHGKVRLGDHSYYTNELSVPAAAPKIFLHQFPHLRGS
jgi:hypothetical protein